MPKTFEASHSWWTSKWDCRVKFAKRPSENTLSVILSSCMSVRPSDCINLAKSWSNLVNKLPKICKMCEKKMRKIPFMLKIQAHKIGHWIQLCAWEMMRDRHIRCIVQTVFFIPLAILSSKRRRRLAKLLRISAHFTPFASSSFCIRLFFQVTFGKSGMQKWLGEYDRLRDRYMYMYSYMYIDV